MPGPAEHQERLSGPDPGVDRGIIKHLSQPAGRLPSLGFARSERGERADLRFGRGEIASDGLEAGPITESGQCVLHEGPGQLVGRVRQPASQRLDIGRTAHGPQRPGREPKDPRIVNRSRTAPRAAGSPLLASAAAAMTRSGSCSVCSK